MIKILYVGIGGFLGAIARYGASGMVHRIFDKTWFPLGTLVVNVGGCLFIGFLGGLAEKTQFFGPEMRLLVFIGFLGGFTTFSTFGFEIINFARDGEIFSAFLNLLLHIILGIGSVWIGLALSKLL
jgi:CrcB protein